MLSGMFSPPTDSIPRLKSDTFSSIISADRKPSQNCQIAHLLIVGIAESKRDFFYPLAVESIHVQLLL